MSFPWSLVDRINLACTVILFLEQNPVLVSIFRKGFILSCLLGRLGVFILSCLLGRLLLTLKSRTIVRYFAVPPHGKVVVGGCDDGCYLWKLFDADKTKEKTR